MFMWSLAPKKGTAEEMGPRRRGARKPRAATASPGRPTRCQPGAPARIVVVGCAAPTRPASGLFILYMPIETIIVGYLF